MDSKRYRLEYGAPIPITMVIFPIATGTAPPSKVTYPPSISILGISCGKVIPGISCGVLRIALHWGLSDGQISSGGMYEYRLRVTDPLPILAYISFMIDWSAVCTARSNLRIIHQKSESRL